MARTYKIQQNTCPPLTSKHNYDLYHTQEAITPRAADKGPYKCVLCTQQRDQSPIYLLLPLDSSGVISVSISSHPSFALFRLPRSSLSLCSSWQGEITSLQTEVLSARCRGWWNTGHQSNTASLAATIQSWSLKSVYLVGLIRRFLISSAHPAVLQKHTPLWCGGTKDSFRLSLNLNPFKGAIIRFSFVIIQPSSRLL